VPRRGGIVASGRILGRSFPRRCVQGFEFEPDTCPAWLRRFDTALFFCVWTLHSGLRLFEAHRQLLEGVLLPLVGGWSLLQLTVICALAGLCEESLFRGAIQLDVTQSVGIGAALVLASDSFGCAHLITWSYAIFDALIGGYLGSLWIWTGNLLTPMIAHAVYDLAALVYLLRFFQKR